MGNSLHLCLPLVNKKEESYPPYDLLKTCSPLPEDRISSLSDDILMVILAFLTYKDVVKTSLLSRRWMNLWTYSLAINVHVPVPNAARLSLRDRQDCVKYVNHVIHRHNAPCLEEFKILCHLDKRNQDDIDNWLAFAIAKKVQRLELNLSYSKFMCGGEKDYTFPNQFLNSSIGKLISDGGGGSRFLPFDLKCLTSLSLQRVNVSPKAVDFFLLNCPFLERLQLVENFSISELVILGPNMASALKHFQIKYSCIRSLNISNINLVSLDILSPIPPILTLTNLPMLVDLSILDSDFQEVSSYYSQLEALSLFSSMKDITTILSNFNQLVKLKRLVISTLDSACPTTLIRAINSCPRLEEFVFMHWWSRFEPLVAGIMPWIHEPSMSSSLNLKSESLKVFEFKGYICRNGDVGMIKKIVDYAVCLEKIIIDPCLFPVPDQLKATKYKRKQEIAKANAVNQFKFLRESIVPAHVDLLLIH